MLILALDTTLAACSAAIYDSAADNVVAHRREPMQQGHAERLAGMAREVAGEAGIGFEQLDRIAVTIGPGTFTGVRIGLAMARGLGVALDIPVVGVGTMQALAANVDDNPDKLPIAVIMDARRDAVYLQVFSPELEALWAPQCIKLDQVADMLPETDLTMIGSGTGLLSGKHPQWRPSAAPDLPDARLVARIASKITAADGPPSPLYLRPADAKPQKPQIKLARLPITISPAGQAHAGVLAVIHGECFTAAWSEQSFAEMMASPGTTALIASRSADDEPVGFILMRQAADEAEIITLCVRPNVQRRGVAAKLLDRAVQHMKAADVSRFSLEVRDDGAAARGLYAAAGFAETGRRANYYKLEDGVTVDAITMSLAL